MMTTHRQVNVNGIDVDAGLARLLGDLWDAGIQTQFSCQGDPLEAMIVFASVTDAVRFVQETLAVTGNHACYSDHLPITMAAPSGGPMRAVVRWPFRFTPAWEAAWNGSPMPLDDFLELVEPGFKAELERLDREEANHA